MLDNVCCFFGCYGNLFGCVGIDVNGCVLIEWGVYGVLEIFVVGCEGIIVYKLVGLIMLDNL